MLEVLLSTTGGGVSGVTLERLLASDLPIEITLICGAVSAAIGGIVYIAADGVEKVEAIATDLIDYEAIINSPGVSSTRIQMPNNEVQIAIFNENPVNRTIQVNNELSIESLYGNYRDSGNIFLSTVEMQINRYPTNILSQFGIQKIILCNKIIRSQDSEKKDDEIVSGATRRGNMLFLCPTMTNFSLGSSLDHEMGHHLERFINKKEWGKVNQKFWRKK